MKIALVGNQNCGKTTLFNLLTGSNQKIGNWPGVTIERKSGIIKDTNHELIDLPGIYSLSSYSEEEKISNLLMLHKNILQNCIKFSENSSNFFKKSIAFWVIIMYN